MLTLSSVEAQTRFGELLESAQREPVTITRHGRPVATILSTHELQSLMDAARRGTTNDAGNVLAAIQAFRKSGNRKGGTSKRLLADCSRRLNIDPPCRFNIDPGPVAAF